MKKIMNWLKNEESGQGMVEYGLIIGLVSIVAIGALILMSDSIEGIFGKAKDALASAD